LACLALAATGREADAQRLSTTERLARIHRLEARRVQLDREHEAATRERARAAYPDTLHAGLFRVAIAPELRSLVVPVAEQVSRELQERLDGPARDSLLRWVVSVRRVRALERRYLGLDSYLATIGRDVDRSGGVGGGSFTRPGALRSRLEALIASASTSSFDAGLRAWLFNGPIAPVPVDETLEHEARVELAVAESHPARRCVSGELQQCAAILAIHGRPADPLHEWYAPSDYRALATRLRMAPADGRAAPQLQRRCLTTDVTACDRLLSSLAPERIPPPVMQGPRRLLLQEALTLGGNDALHRLRPATADIGARLASASGVSEDSLLASWHRRMVAPRGASLLPSGGVALASVGWMLALTGIALRRTRRCS